MRFLSCFLILLFSIASIAEAQESEVDKPSSPSPFSEAPTEGESEGIKVEEGEAEKNKGKNDEEGKKGEQNSLQKQIVGSVQKSLSKIAKVLSLVLS